MRTFSKRLFPRREILKFGFAAFQVVGHLMETGFAGAVAVNVKSVKGALEDPGALKG
jgi:hypothetical protein